MAKIFKSEDYIDKGKSIGVFMGENGCEVKHCHDFIEIVYIASGEGKHFVDNDAFAVKSGDLLFINYGAEHYYDCGEGYVYYNVSFNPEYITAVLEKEKNLTLLLLSAFNELCNGANGGKVSFGKEKSEV